MTENHDLLSQNRLLSEEVKRRTSHVAAINAVAASVSQSLDLNETLSTALQTVLDMTEAEAGGISLIEEATGDVVLRAQQGWIHDFVYKNPMRIPHGAGMSGQVVARRQRDRREQPRRNAAVRRAALSGRSLPLNCHGADARARQSDRHPQHHELRSRTASTAK